MTRLIAFRCQTIGILLVYDILEGEGEDEKWDEAIKRDAEFKKFGKVLLSRQLMKRDSWRDANRH